MIGPRKEGADFTPPQQTAGVETDQQAAIKVSSAPDIDAAAVPTTQVGALSSTRDRAPGGLLPRRAAPPLRTPVAVMPSVKDARTSYTIESMEPASRPTVPDQHSAAARPKKDLPLSQETSAPAAGGPAQKDRHVPTKPSQNEQPHEREHVLFGSTLEPTSTQEPDIKVRDKDEGATGSGEEGKTGQNSGTFSTSDPESPVPTGSSSGVGPPERPPAPPRPDGDPDGPIRLSTEIVDVALPRVVQRTKEAMERASEALASGVPDTGIIDDLTPQEEAEYEAIIDSEAMVLIRNKYFWNTLVRTLNRTDYVPSQDRQTQVLDLACGDGEGDVVIHSLLGGSVFGEINQNVHLIGIDIDRDKIAKAEINNPLSEYIHGDASRLEDYPQVPNEVDAVFVRHQNIGNPFANPEKWRTIFKQGTAKLREGGVMMVTSYLEHEHEMAENVFKEVEQQALREGSEYTYNIIKEENEYTEMMRGMNYFPDDKFILVIEKKRREKQQEQPLRKRIKPESADDNGLTSNTVWEVTHLRDEVDSLVAGEVPQGESLSSDENPERPINLSTQVAPVEIHRDVQRIREILRRNADAVARGVEPPDDEELSYIELNRVLESNDMQQARRGMLWNMFREYIGNRTNYAPPQGRPTTVLMPQCGNCEAGEIAESYLGGGSFESRKARVNIFGVDANPLNIENAIERYSLPDPNDPSQKVLPQNYTFICADPRRLSNIAEIPEQVDAAVIRNADTLNPLHDPDVWPAILMQTLYSLREGGVLTVTTLYEDERHEAARIIRALDQLQQFGSSTGYEIVVEEENQEAGSLKLAGAGIDEDTISPVVVEDKHIVVVQKRKKVQEAETIPPDIPISGLDFLKNIYNIDKKE
jgi:SAM-dependent methyltransferase